MKLIRGIHNLNQAPHGCVLTIGSFDGVHRGHQALLQQLREEGRQHGLSVVVMIFEPQPLEFFAVDKTPARLTRLREGLGYLAESGVDYVLYVHFDRRLAVLTAQDFISELLVHRLGVQLLAVGDDFHLGTGRQGDFLLLQKAGTEYDSDVTSVQTFCEGGVRISSMTVRQALADGDLLLAEMLLDRPFSIPGCVAHGDELGRAIGFPTADLSLHYQVSSVKGVYAVEVTESGGKPIAGVTNVDTHPTVTGVCQRLEVHLLDVIMDLYDRRINIVLRKKICNEQRLASLDRSKTQITRDKLTARKLLGLTSQARAAGVYQTEIRNRKSDE